VLLEGSGDRGRVDEREAPVVEVDALGKELGAEPVAVARDRVDAEPRQLALSGIGSTRAPVCVQRRSTL
jgi:hypothetical protein